MKAVILTTSMTYIPDAQRNCSHSCSHHHKWGLYPSLRSPVRCTIYLPINSNRKNNGTPIPQSSSEMPKLWWHALSHHGVMMKMRRKSTSPQYPWIIKCGLKSQYQRGNHVYTWPQEGQRLATTLRQPPAHRNTSPGRQYPTNRNTSPSRQLPTHRNTPHRWLPTGIHPWAGNHLPTGIHPQAGKCLPSGIHSQAGSSQLKVTCPESHLGWSFK